MNFALRSLALALILLIAITLMAAVRDIRASWPIEQTLMWADSPVDELVTHYSVCIKLSPIGTCIIEGQTVEPRFKFKRNPRLTYFADVSAVNVRNQESEKATLRIDALK